MSKITKSLQVNRSMSNMGQNKAYLNSFLDPYTTFSKQNRFEEYEKNTQITGESIGPGSYLTIDHGRKRIKGTFSYKSILGKEVRLSFQVLSRKNIKTSMDILGSD